MVVIICAYYEKNPSITVDDTERTRHAGRTDGRTDGQTDGRTGGVKPVYPPPPQQLRCAGGIKQELNTFRCGRLLATHTVKWKHNLVLSNSQITSNYELIWYGRPNKNKSSNYGYQQDDSTARRHLKSPWALSGSSLHLILVTKRSRSWSWMTPDCSLSIGPPIPEIGLFQNLTLKIQGQGLARSNPMTAFVA